MDKSTGLREIVARLAGVDPSRVDSAFALDTGGLQGSIGRARLDASLRRELGIKNPLAVNRAKIFSELEAILSGSPLAAAASPAGPVAASSAPAGVSNPIPSLGPSVNITNGFSCGIDIEAVENMPVAVDYWEDDFYRLSFSPDEIAYCVSQSHPREHFAARWCAKEALKKCDPAFEQIELNCLETLVDSRQRPFLASRVNGVSKRLAHAVSLSHTPIMAAAMVVMGTGLSTKHVSSTPGRS